MTLTATEAWDRLAGLLPDVALRCGPVPDTLGSDVARGVLWEATAERFLLRAPGVARYLVEDGCAVTIEPVCRDAAEVVRYLRMTPLAALLLQRGWLPLHAAAAAFDGGAVVIAGHSSSGKSTLVARLLRRGWSLLADDLTFVLDDGAGVRVPPTFGEIALWSDSADRLGYHGDETRRVVVQLSDRVADRPLPLRAVFILAGDHSDAVRCTPLPGGEAFTALSVLGYNNHVAEGILGAMGNVLKSVRLSSLAPVWRLSRPTPRWTSEELAEQVMAVVADG